MQRGGHRARRAIRDGWRPARQGSRRRSGGVRGDRGRATAPPVPPCPRDPRGRCGGRGGDLQHARRRVARAPAPGRPGAVRRLARPDPDQRVPDARWSAPAAGSVPPGPSAIARGTGRAGSRRRSSACWTVRSSRSMPLIAPCSSCTTWRAGRPGHRRHRSTCRSRPSSGGSTRRTWSSGRPSRFRHDVAGPDRRADPRDARAQGGRAAAGRPRRSHAAGARGGATARGCEPSGGRASGRPAAPAVAGSRARRGDPGARRRRCSQLDRSSGRRPAATIPGRRPGSRRRHRPRRSPRWPRRARKRPGQRRPPPGESPEPALAVGSLAVVTLEGDNLRVREPALDRRRLEEAQAAPAGRDPDADRRTASRRRTAATGTRSRPTAS